MSKFYDKVYKKLLEVPRGKVTTYQDLAHALNSRAYRAVGTAMAKNDDAPHTPCHRVINADGKIGNYSGGGPQKKIQMLQKEGLIIKDNKILDYKKYLHKF